MTSKMWPYGWTKVIQDEGEQRSSGEAAQASRMRPPGRSQGECVEIDIARSQGCPYRAEGGCPLAAYHVFRVFSCMKNTIGKRDTGMQVLLPNDGRSRQRAASTRARDQPSLSRSGLKGSGEGEREGGRLLAAALARCET